MHRAGPCCTILYFFGYPAIFGTRLTAVSLVISKKGKGREGEERIERMMTHARFKEIQSSLKSKLLCCGLNKSTDVYMLKSKKCFEVKVASIIDQ